MLESLIKKIEKFAVFIAVWKTFLRTESQLNKSVPGKRKFGLIFKGFNSKRKIPYDFKKWKYKDYISDIETIKLTYINRPYSKLLRDKIIFSNFFRNYFRTPENYCLIKKGKFIPLSLNYNVNCYDQFLNLIILKNKIILKPNLSSRGNGIIIIEKAEDNFKANAKKMNSRELEDLLAGLDNYLANEFIEQGDFTKKLFPLTTNTIRINSFHNPSTGETFLKYPALRIGTSVTFPVDNVSQGGIYAYIDVNSGILQEAYQIVHPDKIKKIKIHPESSAQIYGACIPNWKLIRDSILKTAELVSPLIKIVGWDVVATNEGFVVIEGNNGPDFFQDDGTKLMGDEKDIQNFLASVNVR
jgi:hypothetical protein